jgi:hypothetical protein
MKRILFILMGACFLINCKQRNNNAGDKRAAHSVRADSDARTEDSILIHTKAVTDWINNNFRPSVNKQFTLESFSSLDSLPTEPFAADSHFFKNYRSVLRWSPDSVYILDMGSYGSVLLKDTNGDYKVEPGEPDTEVGLLDLRNKVRKRLLMAGPASTIADGKWINNNVLLVTGTFDKTGSGDRDTLMWLINVKEKFFNLYNVKTK